MSKETKATKKKVSKKTGKGGRSKGNLDIKHRKFLDEDTLDQIERLAAIGLPLNVLSYVMNINERTFRRLRENHPEIHDRYMKGRAQGVSKVAFQAFNLASSGKDPMTTRWWIERMASKIMQVDITQNGQEQGEQNQGLTRESLIEALNKDKFIDSPEIEEREEKVVKPSKD